MLSSKDIRNVKFSKSVGGYKQEEVDVLLDKVEADYDQYDRSVRELQGKIEELNRAVESYQNSQNSIQNVLLSAQKLADQIVDDAKTKSAGLIHEAEQKVEDIAVREKEVTAAFEQKSAERKKALEKEIELTMRAAEARKAAIDSASTDAVARQQILFEKLRLEVSAFKAELTKKYKEHLEILQKLPDEVPMDPKHIAEVVAAEVDRVPEASEYIREPEAEPAEEPEPQPAAEPEKAAAAPAEDSGFVIADTGAEPDEEEN